jgi:hypothetical protein
MIIPVIIEATRIITKYIKKTMESKTGKHSTDSLQNKGILGTSHKMQNALQSEN